MPPQSFLLPDMSISIFSLKQLSFGEALEAEGGDIDGFGGAVQDELDQAGARGGGGLEAGAAQSAG